MPGAILKEVSSRGDARSRPTISLWLAFLLLVIVVTTSADVARAQLNIPVVRGDNGLKSGSQPGPGVYITGLVYF